MAVEVTSPRGAANDFEPHEKTYNTFLSLTLLGIIHVVTLVMIVAIFGLAGALWLGSIALALALGTLLFGLFTRGNWKPAVGAFAVTLLFFLISLA
ncbi:aa3-type cytochrome c oxidase subunit IV [Afifella pfennigii]|uniref:aa3-type cytochrome c oxidase subunit IV n=1 Tax=Afifella pfennigii TaxID=209897 RepID=UPI000479156E|nr:aa3-type cytochrome c oxidase subunit IV [Afifella pfennigii]